MTVSPVDSLNRLLHTRDSLLAHAQTVIDSLRSAASPQIALDTWIIAVATLVGGFLAVAGGFIAVALQEKAQRDSRRMQLVHRLRYILTRLGSIGPVGSDSQI